MKSRSIIFIFLALFSIVSCYKESPVVSELGEVKYDIEDSSDPTQHYIYETMKNTGVYILTDYDINDYKWDVSSSSTNVLVPIKDSDVKAKAISLLKETLFDLYDNDFKSNYFPLKVMVADSINNIYYANNPIFTDRKTSYGRSYVVMGRMRSAAFPKTPEEIMELRGEYNSVIWSVSIIQKGLVTLPQSFYDVCEELYNTSAFSQPDKDDPAFLKSKGFWKFSTTNVWDSYAYPDKTGDIANFIEMIVTHTSKEMQRELQGFEKLTFKYNLLLKTIKDTCGIDLQAIGNKK